jgi:hypothetical protein
MGRQACHDGEVLERAVRLRWPVDVRAVLGPLRRGGRDMCMRVGPDGVWRATRTPDGSATLRARSGSGGCEVVVSAWGPGAAWVVEHAPAMVGALDDPDRAGFRPDLHPVVAELWRRWGPSGAARFGRSGMVTEVLVPTVIEQKVVGLDARQSYRDLVRRFGEPAPGPAGPLAGLFVPPSPTVLAGVPSWVFHKCNVERKRADSVRLACRVAHRLDEAASLGRDVARSRLMALPGVGVWSTAEVMRLALGDADAVSVGDYHLKHLVSYALAGEPRGTDERMLELLSPWAASGQRARVVRLLELGAGELGLRPPRYGPRMPRQSIAAI